MTLDQEDAAPSGAPGWFNPEVLMVGQHFFKPSKISMIFNDMIQGRCRDLMRFGQAFRHQLVIHEWKRGSRVETHDVFRIPTIQAEDSKLTEPGRGIKDHWVAFNFRNRMNSERRYPV